MRTVRRIYIAVNATLFLTLLTGIKVSEGLAVLAGFCLVCWWVIGIFISRWIAVMMVSSLKCKGCGLEIPAVGQWSIGQYTDHCDRHIMLVKSPFDGTRVGHINCPQCSATIMV